MELFQNIRQKIGKTILTNKLATKKRKFHFSAFSQIKKIGIVWDASNTGEFHSLSRFYQKMHERNIDVKIIGYFPGKNLPDQYTAIRYLTCIRRKELDFFYLPVSSETNSFIGNLFDVLIDINFRKLLPLQYITSLSTAAFKVGLFEPEMADTPFELMIETKSPLDIDSYLSQVIQYLEMINSGTVKTAKKQS
jgi:hypothetical protein